MSAESNAGSAAASLSAAVKKCRDAVHVFPQEDHGLIIQVGDRKMGKPLVHVSFNTDWLLYVEVRRLLSLTVWEKDE